jgi:pimeloyl-ACP methyl ester carboxylesterase
MLAESTRRSASMTVASETTHDVALAGVTLHVATWGEPSPDRAVLLVHGITANNRSWAEFGPRLADAGWYAVAPDLRGRGRSAKPPHGYGLPFHAADMLSLADALGIATFHYVGHSLGALIGFYLAALYPGRLQRLTLVDAGGQLPADTVQAIAPALARLGKTYPSLDAYLATLRSPIFEPWEPFWDRYFRYDATVHPDGTAGSCVPPAAIAE